MRIFLALKQKSMRRRSSEIGKTELQAINHRNRLRILSNQSPLFCTDLHISTLGERDWRLSLGSSPYSKSPRPSIFPRARTSDSPPRASVIQIDPSHQVTRPSSQLEGSSSLSVSAMPAALPPHKNQSDSQASSSRLSLSIFLYTPTFPTVAPAAGPEHPRSLTTRHRRWASQLGRAVRC